MHIFQSDEIHIKEVTHKFSEVSLNYPMTVIMQTLKEKLSTSWVYDPSQWNGIIKTAKIKKNKFEVIKMEQDGLNLPKIYKNISLFSSL